MFNLIQKRCCWILGILVGLAVICLVVLKYHGPDTEVTRYVGIYNQTENDLLAYCVQLSPNRIAYKYPSGDDFQIVNIGANKDAVVPIYVDRFVEINEFIVLLFSLANSRGQSIMDFQDEPALFGYKYLHVDTKKMFNYQITIQGNNISLSMN